MGKVTVEGLVNDAEDIDQGHKEALDNAAQLLKANPGRRVKLGLEGQTKEEQKAVYLSLRGTLRQLTKIDGSYGALLLSLSKKDDAPLKAYVKERKKVENKTAKNPGKKGKKPSVKPAQTPAEGQPALNACLEETKKQILKSIENTHAQSLPIALAHYQGILASKQQQLASQGTNEEAAANIKAEIRMFEEVIEIIKKKMGN